MRKVIISVLTCLAGLGILSTMIAAATPPAYAVGCYGGSCTGQDPVAEGCATGAYTIDSFRYYGPIASLNGALLELRYSSACYAAWARVTGGNSNGGCSSPWLYQGQPCTMVIEGSWNRSTVATWIDAWVNGYQSWTWMLSFHYWTRACLASRPPFSSTYTRIACTGWH